MVRRDTLNPCVVMASMNCDLETSMKMRLTRIVECVVVWTITFFVSSALSNAIAQEPENPPYLNPQLSPEQRATDLVERSPSRGDQ